jgi:uncharacterized membrane protein YhaH (DUF805 family)
VEKKAETVGPIGALKNFFLCYARFDGRSSRSEYWWMWLWSALLNLTFFGTVLIFNYASEMVAAGLVITWAIVALSTLVPTYALGARRLRDAGFSPYLLFLFLLGAFGAIPLWVMYALPAKVELPSPPITAS